MNRLAERVVPVMDDDELEAVVDDHYAGEAQTLASGAEANLLKLAELRGRLTPERADRWEAVKAGSAGSRRSAARAMIQCRGRSAPSRCSRTASPGPKQRCNKGTGSDRNNGSPLVFPGCDTRYAFEQKPGA